MRHIRAPTTRKVDQGISLQKQVFNDPRPTSPKVNHLQVNPKKDLIKAE
jgi:hypothetical protein